MWPLSHPKLSSTVLGGDFNCIEDANLDKIGCNPCNRLSGSTQLKRLKEAFDLEDPFRHLYKNELSYTWQNNSTGIKTRIDRFYIDNALCGKVSDIKHLNLNISDHRAVLLEFRENPNSSICLGDGVWKLNNSLLALS